MCHPSVCSSPNWNHVASALLGLALLLLKLLINILFTEMDSQEAVPWLDIFAVPLHIPIQKSVASIFSFCPAQTAMYSWIQPVPRGFLWGKNLTFQYDTHHQDALRGWAYSYFPPLGAQSILALPVTLDLACLRMTPASLQETSSSVADRCSETDIMTRRVSQAFWHKAVL